MIQRNYSQDQSVGAIIADIRTLYKLGPNDHIVLYQVVGHHPVFCVLAELSQEGNLRGEYMHRRLLLPFSLKTRRKPMFDFVQI